MNICVIGDVNSQLSYAMEPRQYAVNGVFFMQGERQESVVIHRNDGYFYHRHHDADRPNSPVITLRCSRRGRRNHTCFGAAVVARNCTLFYCSHPHNHGPDPWHVEELRLRSSVLQAVAGGNPAPFSVIIRDVGVWGQFSMEARSRISVARLRTALREERNRFLPEIPQTLEQLGEFLADPQYAHISTTIDGEDTIFAGVCGDFAAGTFSVVFMSQRLSLFLQQATKNFIDGTFKKRPKKPLSIQMLVISCTWYNPLTGTKHIVVCARILMQSRTRAAYEVLFDFLKLLMVAWNPAEFSCDHERGLVVAIMTKFPNAIVSTCLFHFSDDVFRNAKCKGLGPLMQESWVVNKTVRCCSVLPLLPAELIIPGLISMGYWARYMGAMRYPAMREFFDYMYRQWAPTLPYLSVCGMEDRTNNVSESAHATLGLEIREDRPNVYMLLGAMKRMEDQTMVDLHALRRGRNPGRPQQLRTLRNDARVNNLTDSLRRGNINIVTFLLEAMTTMEAPYNIHFN